MPAAELLPLFSANPMSVLQRSEAEWIEASRYDLDGVISALNEVRESANRDKDDKRLGSGERTNSRRRLKRANELLEAVVVFHLNRVRRETAELRAAIERHRATSEANVLPEEWDKELWAAVG